MSRPVMTKFGTADLSSAALAMTVVVGTDTENVVDNIEILGVYLHASENITETVTVTLTSAKGANYTYTLNTSSLSGAANYTYHPTGVHLKRGDTLTVACTASNETGTVYAQVNYRQSA